MGLTIVEGINQLDETATTNLSGETFQVMVIGV